MAVIAISITVAYSGRFFFGTIRANFRIGAFFNLIELGGQSHSFYKYKDFLTNNSICLNFT
ncbi:MAG TPA: hypothetical protein DDX68_03445 [Clostridium sp.]|nr:hypothetical protein [Clostridium sp.]